MSDRHRSSRKAMREPLNDMARCHMKRNIHARCIKGIARSHKVIARRVKVLREVIGLSRQPTIHLQCLWWSYNSMREAQEVSRDIEITSRDVLLSSRHA